MNDHPIQPPRPQPIITRRQLGYQFAFGLAVGVIIAVLALSATGGAR